jgi:hypothetical protein
VKAFLTDHACRRWNRRRALGNLLTLAVLASWGVVVYMMFVELAGG